MRKERQRSLRNLLFIHEIAFLILVAVTGLLSGLSIYYWRQTSGESVRIINLVYLTEQIRSELFRQIQEAIRAKVLEEREALQLYAEYSRRIDNDFNQLRRSSAARDEDDAIQALQLSYREIQKDMNKVFGDPYDISYVVRLRILDPRFAEHMVGRFEDRYNSFKSLLTGKREAIDQTRKQWTRYAPVVIPVVMVLALFLVFMTSRIVRTGFVRPMATVKEGAAVISRGHLDHRIPESGVIEVAEIAQSINRMAADLAASNSALVEAEKQAALGTLVPVVAHNIRNPLASIRATVQVLEHVDSPEDLRECREAILETIDRLGRWVSALVSYLHPLQPNLRMTKASELCSAALDLLKAKLDEKAIRVGRENWQFDQELEVDPDLMEQAITGLLTNAVEASPRGGEVVFAFARENGRFIIRLSDQGPGLPFEPNPRDLEPGPSTKRFGTGLGIPVAFKICQSHGWDLRFRVRSGQGTDAMISAPATHGREARS
ncbi:MAG: HAMP domain-containing protein [Gammaproteobacteria bacterium]|nr:HAMP domain-containing protein [Gammaproteobacteria bacterium]